MSTTEILAQLASLSAEDQALIRDRLDALDDAARELGPEQQRLIAERVLVHRKNPDAGTTWTVAEDSIRLPWTLDQIVEETRLWPVDAVTELVDRILLSKHGGVEAPVDAAWRSEAQRRVAELESGQVQGIPIEETLAKARKLIGR